MENTAVLKDKKAGIGGGIIALIGLGLLAFGRGKPAAAAVIAPVAGAEAMTAEAAKAVIANPVQAAASLEAYIAQDPTSYGVLKQAEVAIMEGRAEVSDILRLQADLTAHQMYRADGGTESFEEFTITHYSTMPAKYKAVIDQAKDVAMQAWVAEIAEPGEQNIRMLLEGLSPSGAKFQALATAYPELVPEEKREAAAVATQEVVPIYQTGLYVPQPEPPAPAPAVELAEDFTATVKQLEQLATAPGSPAYEEAIDQAYVAAAAQCGEDQVVSWSSAGGYEAIDIADTYAWEYDYY